MRVQVSVGTRAFPGQGYVGTPAGPEAEWCRVPAERHDLSREEQLRDGSGDESHRLQRRVAASLHRRLAGTSRVLYTRIRRRRQQGLLADPQQAAQPKGITFDEKVCCDAGTLEVKPLLWIYRALDPRFAFSERFLRLSPNDELINNTTCKIVYFEKGGVRYSLWTDPARDFVPLRFTSGSPATGEMTTQTDITYRQVASYGWTPTGWRTVQPATGNLRRSVVSRDGICDQH